MHFRFILSFLVVPQKSCIVYGFVFLWFLIFSFFFSFIYLYFLFVHITFVCKFICMPNNIMGCTTLPFLIKAGEVRWNCCRHSHLKLKTKISHAPAKLSNRILVELITLDDLLNSLIFRFIHGLLLKQYMNMFTWAHDNRQESIAGEFNWSFCVAIACAKGRLFVLDVVHIARAHFVANSKIT